MAAISCQSRQIPTAPQTRHAATLVEETYRGGELAKSRELARFYETSFGSRRVLTRTEIQDLQAPPVSRTGLLAAGITAPAQSAKPYISGAPSLAKAAQRRYNTRAAIVLAPRARPKASRKPKAIRGKAVRKAAGGKKAASASKAPAKAKAKTKKVHAAPARSSRIRSKQRPAPRAAKPRSQTWTSTDLHKQIQQAVQKAQDRQLKNRIQNRPVTKERIVVVVPAALAKRPEYRQTMAALKEATLHPWKGIVPAAEKENKQVQQARAVKPQRRAEAIERRREIRQIAAAPKEAKLQPRELAPAAKKVDQQIRETRVVKPQRRVEAIAERRESQQAVAESKEAKLQPRKAIRPADKESKQIQQVRAIKQQRRTDAVEERRADAIAERRQENRGAERSRRQERREPEIKAGRTHGQLAQVIKLVAEHEPGQTAPSIELIIVEERAERHPSAREQLDQATARAAGIRPQSEAGELLPQHRELGGASFSTLVRMHADRGQARETAEAYAQYQMSGAQEGQRHDLHEQHLSAVFGRSHLRDLAEELAKPDAELVRPHAPEALHLEIVRGLPQAHEQDGPSRAELIQRLSRRLLAAA